MRSRREFLQTTSTIAASSTLALLNTGCLEVQQSSFQDKYLDGIYKPESTRKPASIPSNSDDIVIHTLKRTSYGIKQGDIEHVNSIGLSAYIEEQLNPDSIQDDQVNNYISSTYPRLLKSSNKLQNSNEGTIHADLQNATIYRKINSHKQLYEVMVEFWSDHFNIDSLVINQRYRSIDDREVIREHALGKFRDLLYASAKSPAMLSYLNNNTNTKTGPNENYAREVMELHTLGINGGYTENDIKEAARCLTGWSIDASDDSFKFNSSQHDYGDKQLLGNLIPAGQGIEDGHTMLNILIGHPSTAKHIATKLVRKFVTDDPPDLLVNKVIDEYFISDGDIPSMLRVILFSDQFKSPVNIKFKRPIEYISSVYRVLGIDTATFATPDALLALDMLGQTPFEWPSPDGYPDVAFHWNNTQGLATRWEFSLTLSERLFDPKNIFLSHWLSSIKTAEELVDQFSNRILHQQLDNQDRDIMIFIITNNLVSPDEELTDTKISSVAATIVAALLSMPAFMLR